MLDGRHKTMFASPPGPTGKSGSSDESAPVATSLRGGHHMPSTNNSSQGQGQASSQLTAQIRRLSLEGSSPSPQAHGSLLVPVVSGNSLVDDGVAGGGGGGAAVDLLGTTSSAEGKSSVLTPDTTAKSRTTTGASALEIAPPSSCTGALDVHPEGGGEVFRVTPDPCSSPSSSSERSSLSKSKVCLGDLTPSFHSAPSVCVPSFGGPHFRPLCVLCVHMTGPGLPHRGLLGPILF